MRTMKYNKVPFGSDHPLKLFFSVLNLSIISLGDAFGPDFVAALNVMM